MGCPLSGPGCGIRTNLKADVRWTSACSRLDGNNTLHSAKRNGSRIPQPESIQRPLFGSFLHTIFVPANTKSRKGHGKMEEYNLAKNTLDQIPQAGSNAKRIVGLVKKGGRITGYQLSDNSVVEKQQAVNMAKQGKIAGVGIAHRGDTEYLKSIPDGSENNNLGNLPSVSPETQG